MFRPHIKPLGVNHRAKEGPTHDSKRCTIARGRKHPVWQPQTYWNQKADLEVQLYVESYSEKDLTVWQANLHEVCAQWHLCHLEKVVGGPPNRPHVHASKCFQLHSIQWNVGISWPV